MGQINLPTNILDRVKRVEDQISRLWRAVGLSSATIAAGGLTLLNNAFLKMLGPADNELVYIGPDEDDNQVVRISDAAGHIIFGSVSGGTGGQRVAINPTPSGPARIEFYDDVASTTDRVSLSLNGASFVQQREDSGSSAITGGKVSFYSGNSVFGHQSASLGIDCYLQFLDDERIFMRGRWAASSASTGHSALFVGSLNVGSGPVTATVGYGATMAGTMRVVGTMRSPFADHYWAVVASSATGFTVGASGGSSNDFDFWAFRT